MHGKAFNMMAMAKMKASGRNQNIQINPLSNIDRPDATVVKILERLPSSLSRILNESLVDEKGVKSISGPKLKMKKMKLTFDPISKKIDNLIHSSSKNDRLVLYHVEKVLIARWKVLLCVLLARLISTTAIVVFDSCLYPGENWQNIILIAGFSGYFALNVLRLFLVKFLERGFKILFVFYLGLVAMSSAFYEYAISLLTS